MFSAVGYLTSPYAVNSSANFVVGGQMLGEWMAKEIGGKGNVLVVEGIPGASASDSQNVGVQKALSKYPDIQVVGQLAGMCTGQVAQTEMQNWLATNPGDRDGVVVQSASELGAERSLKQSGRDMVPITVGGELGALCYWRKNPRFISSAIHAWPPGDDFEMGWNIILRTLQGQGPKLQSILTRPQVMTVRGKVANPTYGLALFPPLPTPSGAAGRHPPWPLMLTRSGPGWPVPGARRDLRPWTCVNCATSPRSSRVAPSPRLRACCTSPSQRSASMRGIWRKNSGWRCCTARRAA